MKALPPVALPPELAAEVDRYPVRGTLTFAQRRMMFGPYAIRGHTGVESRSSNGATMFNGQKETFSHEQRARFSMQGPDGRYTAKCFQRHQGVRQHEKSLQAENGSGLYIGDAVVSEHSQRTFECTITPPTGEVWTLNLNRMNDSGRLERQGTSFAISSIYPVGNKASLLFDIRTGYAFDAGAEPLAAVQLEMGTVTVTLHNKAPPVLAAACTTLLLLLTM